MRACSLILLAACRGPDAPVVPPDAAPVTPARITATVDSTRFITREHMLASGEMQISGEPFAEAMGRDLGGYNRFALTPNLYNDSSPLSVEPWIDLAGFSTGIESYEYSKQPMNMIALESGAGTALSHAPLVGGDAGLVALVQHVAGASNATSRFVFPAGTLPKAPARAADNPLGWPGLWPTAHVFASFDPTIAPTGDVDLGCGISSDDSGGGILSGDYECDATSLHLPARAAQADLSITPGADGFSGWKYGLWAINYLQVMHDDAENALDSVPPDKLPLVGIPGGGLYLGSSDIEGFQAAMFLAILDNRAEDWLAHLATDGTQLAGFASTSAALTYNAQAPLRYFPARVDVTEMADGSLFPLPSYALGSADSDLLDVIGMLLAYSEAFALTDARNAIVGGAQTAQVYFDGDPFSATGLRDRSLAMLRVSLVNLTRMHQDASGALVDHPGVTTTSTTNVAYALIALRTTRRSLSSLLQLYSNNVPDEAITGTPIDGNGFAAGDVLDAMIHAEADLVFDHLTDDTGHALPGWDFAANAPTGTDDTLDAHAAAIRGLFAAYLATGEVRFRDRALAVYARMTAVFYDAGARIFTVSPAPATDVTYTPVRFALVQSALRDVYELIATGPGQAEMALELETRIGRLNKLVLDGWDDRDGDRQVAWPDECVNVVDDLPRGGLQMAERTLTGETGTRQEVLVPGKPRQQTSDRQQNCVPEIDDAKLPAALAASIMFHVESAP